MSDTINEMTWKQFLDRLQEVGVLIEQFDDGSQYLIRKDENDDLWWTPLPKLYELDGRVGPLNFDQKVRALGLSQNKHFRGWAIIL